MVTRRIERPRYGMVVTDGVAGRVFMLLTQTHPAIRRGDDSLVWDTMRLNTPDNPSTVRAMPQRVFLAPGEFAEVV